jgi:Na+/H+-dicarboxylate symporter
VEMVPDVFRTIGNVTGDLAVTTLVQPHGPTGPADQPSAGNPRR